MSDDVVSVLRSLATRIQREAESSHCSYQFNDLFDMMMELEDLIEDLQTKYQIIPRVVNET